MNAFRYYDKENYTDGYIVPPEDIGKYQLTKDVLEQLKNGIEEFKNISPSSEILAKFIYDEMNKVFPQVSKVGVWENENSCSMYYEQWN